MCDKCVEIDKRIEPLKFIAARTLDRPTLDGIDKLLAKLEAEKIELHPEQNK